jgi:hypothetical protein
MNKIGIIIAAIWVPVICYLYYGNFSTGHHSDDFKVTCVEGQTVLVAEFGMKVAAYNALLPNGNPVACEGDYKAELSWWTPSAIDGDDWEAKCFSGQRVFQANSFGKLATVIALTPNGTPQVCGI